MKGTANGLVLKDPGEKTNRDKRARVEAGRSGGGLRYGYKVEKRVVEAIAYGTIPSMKQKMGGLAAGKRVLTSPAGGCFSRRAERSCRAFR